MSPLCRVRRGSRLLEQVVQRHDRDDHQRHPGTDERDGNGDEVEDRSEAEPKHRDPRGLRRQRVVSPPWVSHRPGEDQREADPGTFEDRGIDRRCEVCVAAAAVRYAASVAVPNGIATMNMSNSRLRKSSVRSTSAIVPNRLWWLTQVIPTMKKLTT